MALACPLTATATTREYTGKPYSPCEPATPSTSKYFTRSPPFSCTPPIPFISSSAVRSGLHVEDIKGIGDRKSTRLNSSHTVISYAVFCLKKKKHKKNKISYN